MSAPRRLGRTVAAPLLHILDSRFADVNRRLASLGETTSAELRELKPDLERVVSEYAASTVESVTFVGTQLRDLQDEIREATAQMGRMADEHTAQMGRMADEHTAQMGRMADEHTTRVVRERFAQLATGALEDLDPSAAGLLNYAFGHTGFAAQSELWMNPPLSVEHREGEVRLAQVNERIVEIPFALRSIAALEAGAKVLDFGSSENSLALSLASLGYEVTALDVRRYPFEHPRLTVTAMPIGEWQAEPGSFDAALCVSTVEHVGLGWYGDPEVPDGDRQALDVIGTALRPGGMLVLTVPYGEPGQDALQRRYDHARLDALLGGWEVLERQIVERSDRMTWLPVEESHAHAVALLVARKPVT